MELPEAMQQVMAMQAEAIREKRARIIKAEAELEASEKLSAASAQMAGNPAALELRRMQMIAEVGAENNSTTVLMIPSDFVTLSKTLSEYLHELANRQASVVRTFGGYGRAANSAREFLDVARAIDTALAGSDRCGGAFDVAFSRLSNRMHWRGMYIMAAESGSTPVNCTGK